MLHPEIPNAHQSHPTGGNFLLIETSLSILDFHPCRLAKVHTDCGL
jgi:hypothetical protein